MIEYQHGLFRVVGIVRPPQKGKFHSNYTLDKSLKDFFPFVGQGNKQDGAEDGDNAFEMSKTLG